MALRGGGELRGADVRRQQEAFRPHPYELAQSLPFTIADNRLRRGGNRRRDGPAHAGLQAEFVENAPGLRGNHLRERDVGDSHAAGDAARTEREISRRKILADASFRARRSSLSADYDQRSAASRRK